ncbi:MAG: hypothetical protein MK066_01300 [Crocinitomicaceae bacterium]|nr:hypothetical protein [Crocinitomicaceae bacterium]
MNRTQPVLKKIAAIAFAVAFLTGINLFLGYGRSYIPIITAQYIFMIAGAVGLVFNLMSFDAEKKNPILNFTYWTASIVIFSGLFAQLMHWPYSKQIILGGMIIMGISFFLKSDDSSPNDDSEILDDF